MTNDTPIPSVIQVPLTKGRTAILDAVDADLAQLSWFALKSNTNLYAGRNNVSKARPKTLLMHRVVLERILGRALLKGEVVDHVNGLTLDNRRCNLRVASVSENAFNRGKQTNNKSGYKGVEWHKYTNRWHARIGMNGKSISVGYYQNVIDAARAYDAAAYELHGEFANLNIIPDEAAE